ncbi:MAG: fasciclin domain-containing protein, partial [Lysobacteraceae bacterium]
VNGNKSYVETPDVRQSNGVVHVVNGVVLPKLN